MHVIILAGAALVGIVAGSLWHLDPARLVAACALAAVGACLGWRQPRWRMLALVACASALGAARASLVPVAQPSDALRPYLGTRVRLRAQLVELPRLVDGGRYARLALAVGAIGPPGQEPPPLVPSAAGAPGLQYGARPLELPYGPAGPEPAPHQSASQGALVSALPEIVVLVDPAASVGVLGQGERVTLEGRLVANAAEARGPPLLRSARLVGEQAGASASAGLSGAAGAGPSAIATAGPSAVAGAGPTAAAGAGRSATAAAAANGAPDNVIHGGDAPVKTEAIRGGVMPDDAEAIRGGMAPVKTEAIRDGEALVNTEAISRGGERVDTHAIRGDEVPVDTDAIRGDEAPVNPAAPAQRNEALIQRDFAPAGRDVAPAQPNAAPGVAWLARVMRSLANVRQAAAANIQRYLPEPQASLAVGVLLGGAGHLSPDVKLDLQRSGLTHVLAIDGYKQVLVAALANALVVRLFGVRVAILTTVAFISGYTLLTGAHPSAVRAALMLGLASVATLSGRVADPLTSLALVVLVLAAVEPPILFDVGLQLSASATLGIILLWPALRRRLQRLPRWIAEPLGLSAAVTLATLPVTLCTFQFVSLVSPIAHVVAVPLLPLVLASTTLLAIVAAFPPPNNLVAWLAALPALAGSLAPSLPTSTASGGVSLSVPLAWLVSLPPPIAATGLTTHLSTLKDIARLVTPPPPIAAAAIPLSASIAWLDSLPPLIAAAGRTTDLLTPNDIGAWLVSLPPLVAAAGLTTHLSTLEDIGTWLARLTSFVAVGTTPNQPAPLGTVRAGLVSVPPPTTFATLLTSPVLIAAWLAWLPTTLLAWVIHAFGSVPAAGVSTGRLPRPASVALGASLLGYGVWQLPELANLRMAVRRWQSRHPKLVAPSACAAACLGAAAVVALVRPDGQVHVEPLSLTRGRAVFIRGPSGYTALIVSGQPSPTSLASQVAQNLAVWEHQLNLVVALDGDAQKAVAQTLARYPADQLITHPGWDTLQRLELGRGAAIDVWSVNGQLRVALDETTSVPTTFAARPGSAD